MVRRALLQEPACRDHTVYCNCAGFRWQVGSYGSRSWRRASAVLDGLACALGVPKVAAVVFAHGLRPRLFTAADAGWATGPAVRTS